MSLNPELQMTLDDAIEEVLNILTGLDLQYEPELDRYNAITRVLNRALRLNALEKEWSWYSSHTSLGLAVEGEREVYLPSSLRPRIINDDAVLLVDLDHEPQHAVRWAFFLPRDAIDTMPHRAGLRVAVTKNLLTFSRPFSRAEDGLDIQLPVMREPEMFRLPAQPEDPEDPLIEVPDETREQLVDFSYPDVILLRAAMLYAQTDPVMQPRVPQLEAQYKDLMYQAIERDDRNTDHVDLNPFFVPVSNGVVPHYAQHFHPHADERR